MQSHLSDWVLCRNKSATCILQWERKLKERNGKWLYPHQKERPTEDIAPFLVLFLTLKSSTNLFPLIDLSLMASGSFANIINWFSSIEQARTHSGSDPSITLSQSWQSAVVPFSGQILISIPSSPRAIKWVDPQLSACGWICLLLLIYDYWSAGASQLRLEALMRS